MQLIFEYGPKYHFILAKRMMNTLLPGLVGCSPYALGSTYQKRFREKQPVNQQQGHGQSEAH